MLNTDPYNILFEAIYNRLVTSRLQFIELLPKTEVNVVRDYEIHDKQLQLSMRVRNDQRLIVMEYNFSKPEVSKRLTVNDIEEDQFTWSFVAFYEIWNDIVMVDLGRLQQRASEKF